MNYNQKSDNLKYVVNNRTGTRFYHTTAWRKLRAWFIELNPLCKRCLDNDGRAVPAQMVDHIKPIRVRPQLKLEPSNLQSLCNSCHAIKTNEDKEKYGAPKY